MARWTASAYNWTPTAVADTTNFTDSGYMALQGGSTTQRLVIEEVYMGGLASSSAPAQMVLARDSTVGATLSGGTNAAQDPSTAALGAPPTAFTIATTKPQRSSTLKLLALAFNAYGGIVRWAVPQAEGIGLLGNTASLGEVSLSHLSSGTPGLMASHFIYEPL
jgi:hypothetical protein